MKKPFSFIHAADIHLDSPLGGLPTHDTAAAETIRAAPRSAFERLVDTAIARKVSFVVIAGDLYDGSQRDINTAIFFGRQMARLQAVNIPVYVLFGNHDFESPVTGQIPRSPNLHCFPSNAPGSFHIEELGVSLHGQSFPRRDVVSNLASQYPAPASGHFNIGVLHTALGRIGHDPYAPASPEQLRDHGYQYWALGHVHQHEIAVESPPVVFPGNIQGRHIGETGPKGAMLVHVASDGRPAVERLVLDSVRWHRVSVDCSEHATIDDVVNDCAAAIGRQVQAATDLQPGHLHAIRVDISGETALHGELLWLSQSLHDDIAAAASTSGARIWIEQVDLRTGAPAAPVGEIGSELRSLLERATEDPETLSLIYEDQTTLQGIIPRDVYDVLRREGRLWGEGPAAMHELAREGADIALARLVEAKV
ncbi:metallophosphoesterase family protein [Nevskia ramosa]|uniref:metallophosphoesterase family protein n=1 Tax=Nevskia ramosa TaxID=64002 RepID=UPI0023532F38|nr:DNA repair exonuclease [Nevskia ramosa]